MSWYQERFGGDNVKFARYVVPAILCLNVGAIAQEVSASGAEGTVFAGEIIGGSLLPAILGAGIGLIVWALKGKNTPRSVLIPEYIFYTAIVMIVANWFLLVTR